jgi:hypothetical protein
MTILDAVRKGMPGQLAAGRQLPAAGSDGSNGAASS